MGNSRQNNINYDSNEKNLPLFVGSHETQGFMNEIIKTSRERKKKRKRN
ncbi:MAG: hypothetical protein K2X69_02110 [Silvanigrellaceae bacterium]|nr:hypothetical protein [Silvanigrellaceae bacterium]